MSEVAAVARDLEEGPDTKRQKKTENRTGDPDDSNHKDTVPVKEGAENNHENLSSGKNKESSDNSQGPQNGNGEADIDVQDANGVVEGGADDIATSGPPKKRRAVGEQRGGEQDNSDDVGEDNLEPMDQEAQPGEAAEVVEGDVGGSDAPVETDDQAAGEDDTVHADDDNAAAEKDEVQEVDDKSTKESEQDDQTGRRKVEGHKGVKPEAADDMKLILHGVLEKVVQYCKTQFAWGKGVFMEPAEKALKTEELRKDYRTIIKQPICLNDISKKLKGGKYSEAGKYTLSSLEALGQDLKLMSDNCMEFNHNGDLNVPDEEQDNEFFQAGRSLMAFVQDLMEETRRGLHSPQ